MGQLQCSSNWSQTYYSNAPEKNEKELWIVKNRAANVIKKQVLLSVHFRDRGKEKQKVHFTKTSTNKEKVQEPYNDMWKLPQKALKSLNITCEEVDFSKVY